MLPEDDPLAMTNLCFIAHWMPNRVRTGTTTWLQRLAILCDKYKCAEKLQHFFEAKLNDDESTLDVIDKAIIAGLTGCRDLFQEFSTYMVRHSKGDVHIMCHKGLSKLLPVDTLGASTCETFLQRLTRTELLATYRRYARLEYSRVMALPILMMQSAHDGALCWGLEKRLAKYWQMLNLQELLTFDVQADLYLTDLYLSMDYIVEQCIDGKIEGLKRHCRNTSTKGCGCSFDFLGAIKQARSQITSGREGTCSLCFDCFRGGQIVVLHACRLHGCPERSPVSLENIAYLPRPI